jgi:hypothetical protein
MKEYMTYNPQHTYKSYVNLYVYLGVSIVKWIILSLAKVEVEVIQNYIQTLSVMKIKITNILRHIDLQGQALYTDKKKASKIVYIIQKRVQVVCKGEIKQIVV